MIKNLVTCFILLSFCHTVFCQKEQDSTEKVKGSNAIYFELGGSAIRYSVNYEHGFMLKKNRNKINGRLGFEYFNRVLIPIGTSIDIGKNKNFFQMSLNRTFDFAAEGSINVSNTSFGLAYVRRPAKGLYFRLSCLYLIFDEELPNWDGTTKATLWPGIGVGHSF